MTWTRHDGIQVPVIEMGDKHILRAINRVTNFHFKRMTLEEHEACIKSLLPLRDELRRRGLEVPWSYYRAQGDLRVRILEEEGR